MLNKRTHKHIEMSLKTALELISTSLKRDLCEVLYRFPRMYGGIDIE